MVPAPQLPTALEDGDDPLFPGPALPRGTESAVPASGEVSGALASIRDLIVQISEVHRQHMDSVAALHRQFIAMREATTLSSLLGRPLELPAEAPLASASLPLAEPEPLAEPDARADAVRVEPAPPPGLPGPKFSRAELENLPAGKVYPLLGPAFAHLADYPNQIRLPRPPFLLADRITGIEGELGSMTRGVIWSETDLTDDTWFIDHCGRIPASLFCEGPQINLLLNAYLGADLQHQGDRLCRLVEFDVTFHGPLPKVGETVAYDFHVERVAEMAGTTLFFATANLNANGVRLASSSRTITGVFPATASAEASGGAWDAKTDTRELLGRVDPPELLCTRSTFDRAAIVAFARGDAYACFGSPFERAATHVRTPRIPDGRLLLLDEITAFDPAGGPWRRGYLRAEMPIAKDAWFFAAHFPDDPCMPGMLMFEGCLQAMSFYMAALGLTARRDCFRFEPVLHEHYVLKFRSPIVPTDRRVTFEVFVESVSSGPVPTVIADLVCTVDGRQAFHARRFGWRLVPDWPLEAWRRLPYQEPGEAGPVKALAGLNGYVPPKPSARLDVREFGYPAMLAAAWGRVADAFGERYGRFDGPDRIPRLPGPPFLFITRVIRLAAEEGKLAAGSVVETEYEAPLAAWYYTPGSEPVMPLPVLLEALLQVCGWISCFLCGGGDMYDSDVYYRNLDGSGTVRGEVKPADVLRVRATLTSVSRIGETCLFGFRIESFVGDRPIFDIETTFGQFPSEALKSQAGVVTPVERRQRVEAPADFAVDLRARPPRYFRGTPALPDSMLLMLDRVTACAPNGGREGLGYARAEFDVDPGAWFFKAHFLRDPVQPGSLGIEALCQLLQFFMIERGLGRDVPRARFESPMLERSLRWQYRGQVLPESKRVTTEIEVTELGADDKGPFAVADAWLWVDGVCVYSVSGLGMRIVSGDVASTGSSLLTERVLDPQVDTWLADHCPTWTVPTLPIVVMADFIAAAAQAKTGHAVTGISNLQVRRWLVFPGPVRLRVEVDEGVGDCTQATLLAWREARTAGLSRFEPVATAEVFFGPASAPPRPLDPIDGEEIDDPYAVATVFHGPSFQVVVTARSSALGASGVLNADRCAVPSEVFYPGLLDAVFHVIRADEAWRTWPEAPRGRTALPNRIESLRLYRRLDPRHAEVRIEARPVSCDGEFATLDMQLIAGGEVLVEMRVVLVLLPTAFGDATPEQKRAFLRDKKYLSGLSLSRVGAHETELDAETVRRFDWIPGNVAAAYGVPLSRQADLVAEVAVREHVARRAECHPSLITTTEPDVFGNVFALAANDPPLRYPVQIIRTPDTVRVADAREVVEER